MQETILTPLRKVPGVRPPVAALRKVTPLNRPCGSDRQVAVHQSPRPDELPRLAVDASIFPQIVRECERFKRTETGSTLLGRSTCDERGRRVIQIEVCLPPGEQVDRNWASFGQSSQLHERLLEWYQASDPTVRYLGDWHKHAGLERPSNGDLMTARSILGDPEFGVDEILVVIACHRAWSWLRRPAERWLVEALRGTRIDPDDYCVRFFYLNQRMLRFTELQPQIFRHRVPGLPSLEQQWYVTNSARWERELSQLSSVGAAFRLQVGGRQPNLQLLVAEPHWHNQLLLLTGRDYPAQRPGGFVLCGASQHCFSPQTVGLSWSPERNLAQFLYAALSHGLHQTTRPERTKRKGGLYHME